MKTALKITALLAILGLPFSAQATFISPAESSTLPTFHVYASDQEANDTAIPVVEWEFQKSIDSQLEPVAVQVLVPGEETQVVNTPAISISLVSGLATQS